MRGASGGLLFGVPLLYTMEVWWTGQHTTAVQAYVVLALTFAALYVLNSTSGFRSTADIRRRDAAIDAVEALALGVVVVTIVLFVLREVTTTTPLSVSLSKVVYETLPFCLGVGVANHFLRGGRDDVEEGERQPPDDRALSATVADVGATSLGAVFISLNVAPTDEIEMLANAMTTPWIIGLVAASLLASYGIVFVAGFVRQDRRHSQMGIFQRPVSETVVCYLVALLCAWLMLELFQRLDHPWHLTLEHVVILGFPACIGGAAGRLAI